MLNATPRCCWFWIIINGSTQVFADALTLGLMCYASVLDPDDDDDNDRLELIYASALLVQVRRPSQYLVVLLMLLYSSNFCCGFPVVVGTIQSLCFYV